MHTIKLNKKSHTFQVVHKPARIELSVAMPKITLQQTGLRGPAGEIGPVGPEGPQGPPGETAQGSDKAFSVGFIGAQVTVNHNFGKYPAVTVMTSAGDEVEGEVEHISPDQLVVSFNSSFSGVVNCN